MIKAVIFDVGGVLIKTLDRTSRNNLETRLGMKPGESEDLVFNSETSVAAQTGDFTIHSVWGSIQQRFGFTDEQLQEFKQDFWAGDKMDYEVIEYVRSFKGVFATAIISNYFDDLHDKLHNEFGVSDAFDLIVCSAIEGVMKPDVKIFTDTLKRLNVAAQEAVFIDDMQTNVDAASTLGMQTIKYEPGIDLIEALQDLGVQP